MSLQSEGKAAENNMPMIAAKTEQAVWAAAVSLGVSVRTAVR